MKDLPCWLNSDDKEVANALLELDWSWLDQEAPENWEEQIWERKICKYRGWQFWSVPGEVCLLISRNGAVFGLCLEVMNPKPDFEGEIKKAKSAISRVIKLQELRKPKQLTLFLLGLCLLLCSCSQSEADKYFGNSRHDNCYEKPASDPCYKEAQPTTAHWCESSPNPAECESQSRGD
jgi:hypothetical protein